MRLVLICQRCGERMAAYGEAATQTALFVCKACGTLATVRTGDDARLETEDGAAPVRVVTEEG